ncbi:MAG: hypothetical protein WBX20_04535, partial [Terrimicrobiaceae bacterium]
RRGLAPEALCQPQEQLQTNGSMETTKIEGQASAVKSQKSLQEFRRLVWVEARKALVEFRPLIVHIVPQEGGPPELNFDLGNGITHRHPLSLSHDCYRRQHLFLRPRHGAASWQTGRRVEKLEIAPRLESSSSYHSFFSGSPEAAYRGGRDAHYCLSITHKFDS